MEMKQIIRHVNLLNWFILLVIGTVSFFFMKGGFTTGIIAGGLIIIANFHIMQKTILRGFSPKGVLSAKKSSIIAKYYLRLAGMGVLIYFLISSRWVHPVGLTIGLSVVFMSIISLGILMFCKTTSGRAI